MSTTHKTNEQLEQENKRLQQKIAALEASKKQFQKIENLLSALFAGSTDPIAIYGLNDKVIAANPIFIKVFGYDEKELIGQHFPGDAGIDMGKFEEWVKICKTGQGISGYHTIRKSKDGTPIDVSISISPVQDTLGNLVAMSFWYRDITEQKQTQKALEQSEKYYHNLFENAHDAIIIFNPENEVVLDVNLQACKMYGFSRSEFIGFSLKKISKNITRGEKHIRATLNVGYYHHFQTIQYKKDGSELYLEINASVIEHQGKQAILTINRDITQRKKSEEKLQQSEQEKSLILNSTYELIAYYDENFRIKWANKAAADSVGKKPEDLIGHHCYEIWHERSEPLANCPVKKALETKKFEENQLKTPDGKFWHARAYPVLDGKGNLNGLIEFTQNITEQKLTEAALRESHEKYMALYNNAPLSYQSLDENGCFIDVNPTWLQILGYSRKEVIGKCFSDFLHPDWKSHFQKNFSAFKKRGHVHNVQFQIRHKSGRYIHISFEGCIGYTPEGKFRQTYCVFKDITEQKRMEQELIESEDRFRALMEQSPLGIAVFDLNGILVKMNEAFRLTWGFPKEIADAMIGKYNILKSARANEDLGFHVLLQKGFSGEIVASPPYESDVNKTLKELGLFYEGARVRWLQSHLYPLKDSAKNPVEIVCVNHDITEQKLAEKALIEKEKFYHDLFETNRAVKLIIEPDTGRIIKANSAACQFYGYPIEKLETMSIKDINQLPPDEVRKEMERARLQEKLYFHFRHKLASEEIRDVEVYSGPVIFNGKELLYSIIHDITARKKAEAQLKESERRYRTLAEELPNGAIFLLDKDLRYKLVAGNILIELGLNPKHLIGKTMYDIFPKEVTDAADNVDGKIFNGDSVYYEVNFNDHIFGCWGVPICDDGETVVEGLIFAMDITDLKKKENDLKLALAEKTALLKELYHRTKNNMQVMISMLGLQSDYVRDEKTLKLIQEIRNRLEAMALVHQKLYKGKNLSRVDLGEYIVDLSYLLLRTYRISPDRISMEYNIEENIPVLYDIAIPCGLVINEVITNSFLHAFPDNRKGTVSLGVKRANNNKIQILIGDNGVGVPIDFNFRHQDSLGLHLVFMIAESQLQGDIKITGHNGVKALLQFQDVFNSERV